MICNTRCNFQCSDSYSGFSFGGCGISSSAINIYGNLHQFRFQRQIDFHFTCIYFDLHNLYWCLVYNLWKFISWRDWFTAILKKQGHIPSGMSEAWALVEQTSIFSEGMVATYMTTVGALFLLSNNHYSCFHAIISLQNMSCSSIKISPPIPP